MLNDHHTPSLNEEVALYQRFINEQEQDIERLVIEAKNTVFADQDKDSKYQKLQNISPYLSYEDRYDISQKNPDIIFSPKGQHSLDDINRIALRVDIHNRNDLQRTFERYGIFLKTLLGTSVINTIIIDILYIFYQNAIPTSLVFLIIFDLILFLVLYLCEKENFKKNIQTIRSTYEALGFLDYYKKPLYDIKGIINPYKDHIKSIEEKKRLK